LTKEVLKLDVEFFEYKAEAKASMDALEKKIDDGIGKLDASIKAMKEGWDAMYFIQFEELKVLDRNSGWIRKRAIDREMQHMGEQIFGAGLELIVGLDSRAFEGLNCHLGKGEERITWNPRIKHHPPFALRALSQRLSRGFNEVVNGFADEGWSMMGTDGMDDVTILVNSSLKKLTS
ncbi:hypothetical protein Tco_0209067, partial [Tanacetum coccineum]